VVQNIHPALALFKGPLFPYSPPQDHPKRTEAEMIRGVRKVIVPVDDQEGAKEFWTTRVGFNVVQDAQYGGGNRWLEVTPPDRGVILVLSPRGSGDARREVSDQLPHSDVFFTCDDIQATHGELAGRGVRFPTPPTQMPFGWWALFEDHEGTRYALGEWS